MPTAPAPPSHPLPPFPHLPRSDGQRTVDADLARLAAAQHGVVTFGQLRTLGLSAGAIEERIRTGRLHRIHRGVFAVGHPSLGRNGRRMAVVLACGPGAALSHTSAADAWGLRVSARRGHVVAPGMSGGRRGPAGVIVHRTLALPASDVTTLDRVPVTSLARTLADLAAVVDERTLSRAVHEAEVLRLLDTRAVLAQLDLLPRRRGAARLRRLLASPDPLVDRQAFVEAFLRLCAQHGLPSPRTGMHLHLPHRLIECDVVFVEARVIVELDGEAVHGTRRNFHADRRRDTGLAAEGYLTVRLTWERVTRESAKVADELRRILRIRQTHEAPAERPLPL